MNQNLRMTERMKMNHRQVKRHRSLQQLRIRRREELEEAVAEQDFVVVFEVAAAQIGVVVAGAAVAAWV